MNLANHTCSAVGINLELFLLLIEVDVESPVSVPVGIYLIDLAFPEVDQA